MATKMLSHSMLSQSAPLVHVHVSHWQSASEVMVHSPVLTRGPASALQQAPAAGSHTTSLQGVSLVQLH